jgi:hypothetical protein
MTGSATADEDREQRIIQEVRRQLDLFCDKHVRKPKTLSRLLVRVRVMIGTSLSDHARNVINQMARQFVTRDLPGAQLDGATFPIRESQGPAFYHVLIEAGEAPRPAAAPTRTKPVHGTYPLLWLEIRYNGAPWRFELEAGPDWLPVGRDAVAAGDGTAIRLPSLANAVPRGGLIELRYAQGIVHWRRSAVPTRYHVTIDGTPLQPGQSVESRADGEIAYFDTAGRSTVLAYQLIQDE